MKPIVKDGHIYVPIDYVDVEKAKLEELKEKMRQLGIEEITHDEFDEFIRPMNDQDIFRGKLVTASCIIKTRCDETGQSIEDVLNEGHPFAKDEWKEFSVKDVEDCIANGDVHKVLNDPLLLNEMMVLLETHRKLVELN